MQQRHPIVDEVVKSRRRISSTEAAANVARLVVERRALVPPIDVAAILAEHADIEGVKDDWPAPRTDAVMVRGHERRPHVFYNDTENQHPGRVRFTLAHELGHILVPWHCGSMSCSPLNGWTTEPTTSEAVSSVLEREADAFASGLVIPRRWLGETIREHRDDMEAFLSAVQVAEVSTTAMLWAIRDHLPVPGWAFQINRQDRLYRSQGTLSHGNALFGGSDVARRFLDNNAIESGAVTWGRNTVRWWRLVGRYDLPALGDTDLIADRELLQRAMTDCGIDPAREAAINGKVGGGARGHASGGDAAELFAGLRYRFANDDQFASLVDHADFLTWLARRAIAKS